MFNFRWPVFLFIGLVAITGLYLFDLQRQKIMNDPQITELQKFRSQAEERLRAPSGWLSVVGLHWIKEGEYTLGSGEQATIRLPLPAPSQLGKLVLINGTAKLRFENIDKVLVDDNTLETAGTSVDLRSDDPGPPTTINIDTVTFFLIKRKNGIGIRVRDQNSEARKNFLGRQWFPFSSEFQIQADWIQHDKPKKLFVPDVIGNINEEDSPGFVRFQIKEKTFELHPTVEDKKLFFVFRDSTSGKETYGAARFLYADVAVDGKVTLDFNRAVNPPCAFTSYATCPMPPAQNILNAAITAGELKPPNSNH